MIIESGLIVALGLTFMWFKCPWKKRMWMLSNPLLMDVIVFIMLNILHWGSFSGVMVAATGSLICSGLITVGRKCLGHIDARIYYPGIWQVDAEELR
jgi:hypothetical protein